MSIFLSYNNNKPYNTLVDLRNTTSLEISSSSGASTVDQIGTIYLIATEQVYTSIEVKVENENSSGVSLYVSPVDGVGNPTHWGKSLILNGIDASTSDIKILLKYKWTAINNIYVLKRLQVSGNINIYEV